MANIQNLKPIKTLSNEEAKKRGSAGGKKSVESRRKKKLMSQIHAEFLSKKHKLDNKELDGEKYLTKIMEKILERSDSSSVSLMKEIREATEGNKLDVEHFGGISTTINILPVSPDGNKDS